MDALGAHARFTVPFAALGVEGIDSISLNPDSVVATLRRVAALEARS